MSHVNHSRRDEELQLLISSGRMIQAVEKLQPITCFCILDQRGSATTQPLRNSDRRLSLITWLPSSSVLPRHCRLPVEPTHHSALTSLASLASECPKEAPWTRFILNLQDIFSFIKKDLNIATQQDAVTESRHSKFVIFCDQDIPLQFFGDACYTEDHGTPIGYNKLPNSAAHWPHSPSNSNSKEIQHELVSRDNFHTCSHKNPLKSCHIYNVRRKNAKKRKSVSFDDDVMVYLFDQVCSPFVCHTIQ